MTMEYSTDYNPDITFQEIVSRLKVSVANYHLKLTNAKEPGFSHKPLEDKWSNKEILGHLCDSAFNNIHRFVRGQYQHQPEISYDQDAWVNLNYYDYREKDDVIALWKSLNDQITNILANIPDAQGEKVCFTKQSQHTLHWLAHDYIDHMEYHLKQIVD